MGMVFKITTNPIGEVKITHVPTTEYPDEVNGIPLARLIASEIMLDSSLCGEHYTHREDELTEKVQKVLDAAKEILK